MGIKEETFYEGGPHIGDLIFHLFLSVFIVFIPLAVGSIVRAIWLRYKITDRRISVIGGWMGKDRTDLVYSEITDALTIPRGLGFWGDMVVTLKDGSRLELRSLPRYREIYDYINERVIAKNGVPLLSVTEKAEADAQMT
ncbi:PH domain-containing protein [Chamaesiphon sp. VAR_48_metabat_135_sub]|uniref:PH domain-containing protein n=1 Tax=Chamaesiphon sp. VAR_48_metabat_135_sub TaxID=2964699 RepID=UPI00286A40E4|nr:PH domain-containing protein [Chamaesiphon sp. VAR_48_metabat_135_sub]